MRQTCGLRPGASVGDIGSGTGIFTRLLLEAGCEVTAVEPNGPMRAAAEEDLHSFPLFHSMAAPAEKTGLPNGAFDAITVAQAFHWFDPKEARQEFRRLLRPRGWVFLIWNDRLSQKSPLARGYEGILETLGKAYTSVRCGNAEAETNSVDELFLGGSMDSAQYENPQVMDWPGLRGRFLSASYVPAPGEPRHKELLLDLEELFKANEVDGCVRFEQMTKVYYGRLQ